MTGTPHDAGLAAVNQRSDYTHILLSVSTSHHKDAGLTFDCRICSPVRPEVFYGFAQFSREINTDVPKEMVILTLIYGSVFVQVGCETGVKFGNIHTEVKLKASQLEMTVITNKNWCGEVSRSVNVSLTVEHHFNSSGG